MRLDRVLNRTGGIPIPECDSSTIVSCACLEAGAVQSRLFTVVWSYVESGGKSLVLQVHCTIVTHLVDRAPEEAESSYPVPMYFAAYVSLMTKFGTACKRLL
jgi:hypothetical protein